MKKLFLFFAVAFLFFSCTSIPKVPTVAEPVVEKNENTIIAVQVSDAHFSREKPLFENTIALINTISPDLLFFTGDQIDSVKSIEIIDHYFKQITCDCKKFVIYGNWDYLKKLPQETYVQMLEENGFSVLKNRQEKLDFSGKLVIVYGVDDLLYGKPSLDSFEPEEAAANIVLAHCPPIFDMLGQYNFPVQMLSGHTHGGQFTFFGSAIYLPDGTGNYYAGHYKNGTNSLYISTGLGNSSYDIRNVPPVIEYITITFDENNNFASINIQPVTVKTN